MLLRTFLISMLFLFSTHSHSASCNLYELRWFDGGKTKILKQKLCQESVYRFVSENCISKKCAAYQTNIKNIPVQEIYRETGTPAANLCRYLGGSPTLYEMKQNSEWIEIDFCAFQQDKSFITSTSVFEFHKGLIK